MTQLLTNPQHHTKITSLTDKSHEFDDVEFEDFNKIVVLEQMQ
jgi:hypothetical protein